MSVTLSLTKDPIPNLIKRIAIPASVGTFFQTMFNIVDVYFAGRISPEALSALTKSFPIYFIIIAACVGVTVGGSSLIANSIGEENKEKILGFFAQTIIFGIIVSLIITLIGHIFAPKLFSLMGSTGQVLSLSLEYTNVVFSGSIAFIIFVALNSLLQADGDTVTYKNILIFNFFLNIFLNPLFIFGYGFIPPLGVAGIGYATILVNILGVFLILLKVLKSKRIKDLSIKYFFPNPDLLKRLFFQSAPISAALLLISVGAD
jgi:putative MATE family efflux protein